MRTKLLRRMTAILLSLPAFVASQGSAQKGYEPYRISHYPVGDTATRTRIRLKSVGGANVLMSAEGPGYVMEFVLARPGPSRVNFNGPGAIQEYEGQIDMPIDDKSYVFRSDKAFPLRFRVEKGVGLVYLSGKGTVTEPSGTVVALPPAGLSVTQWMEHLSDPRSYVREGAAAQLAHVSRAPSDTSKLVSLLVRALDDHEPGVRLHAAESLATIGDRGALPALGRLLDSGKETNKQVTEVVQDAMKRLNQ